VYCSESEVQLSQFTKAQQPATELIQPPLPTVTRGPAPAKARALPAQFQILADQILALNLSIRAGLKSGAKQNQSFSFG